MTDPASTPTEHDYGELFVVQHASHAGPSALTEVLDARAARRPWRLIDAGGGAAFPRLDRARGILVLGGPMGMADAVQHPWLEREIEVLRAARDAKIPVFGICLGVQLLAAALDGQVRRRAVPEMGFIALRRTEAAHDDPVFAGWPDGAAALFVHDDEVVAIPAGAEPMLSGSDGVAAWRAPDGVSYGLRFHPEVDAAQVGAWCRRPENLARFQAAGIDPDALAAEATRRDRFTRAAGLSLVGRWLDAVVGRHDPDPARRRRAGR